jgi:DNA repair protein RadC
METLVLQNITIKNWSEADQPREKMMQHGCSVLSEAELIAILISSGNKDESAVDLSKRILNSINNNLSELGKQSIKDLMKFKGIGEAKAVTIVAALELGKRRKESEPLTKPVITTSKSAYDILSQFLCDIKHEEFWILILNRANKVTAKINISKGGVNGTVADPKIIFKYAIDHLASSIILAHNHPSGNLNPSQEDMRITNKLVDAGKMLEIPVLDHIIISENGYYSFADEEKL